jgi:hypothetical protein
MNPLRYDPGAIRGGLIDGIGMPADVGGLIPVNIRRWSGS